MHIFTVSITFIIIVVHFHRVNMCDFDNELTLSDEQKIKFQAEFLDLLGIPSRPKIMRRRATQSATILLDAFRFLDQRFENTVSADVDRIEKSDIIITLHNENKRYHRIGKTSRLYFSMPKLPKIDRINGAELKIYQSGKANKIPFSKISVAVYRLIKTRTSTALEKISESVTTTDFTGWLTLDISSAFASWVSHPVTVFKLYVSVLTLGTNKKALLPSHLGIDCQGKNTGNRPYVIAFLRTNEKIATRLPRSISSVGGTYLNTENEMDGENCRLKSLKITFKELGWSDWIIAPEMYVSAFCQGRCKFPLKLPINATNHAIVQSLVQLKLPGKYPEPVCAPTVLNPLTILYQDQNNVVLRTYVDMIAGSCGCH